MVLKAQVRTCELRSHEKKKKMISYELDIEVTGPELWCQFWKNENFCFYAPKGKGPDL